jgi:hypothetical protein
MIIFHFSSTDVDMSSLYSSSRLFFFHFLLICLVNHFYFFCKFFLLFRFPFLCFGSIKTSKNAVSILNCNNRNKRLVSDSVETIDIQLFTVRLSRRTPPPLSVISCTIYSALRYNMVARNRNTVLFDPLDRSIPFKGEQR